MFEKSFEHFDPVLFPKLPKVDANGHEWVRHESPQAHIRRGQSHGLSDASGSLPDPIWGGFKRILIDFSKKSAQPGFAGFFLIYPL